MDKPIVTEVIIFLVTYMVSTILKAYAPPASQLPAQTRVVPGHLSDCGVVSLPHCSQEGI